MIVQEMVRRGEFGTPYYAEGEYLHELKGLNEVTRWRRRWQFSRATTPLRAMFWPPAAI